MEEKELLKLVKSFRKGILGKRKPLKMCFAVSAPLSSYLQICGVENELIEGEALLAGHNKGITIGHYWIKLKGGAIIDATASQFNSFSNQEQMPDVYMGKKPKWYREVKD